MQNDNKPFDLPRISGEDNSNNAIPTPEEKPQEINTNSTQNFFQPAQSTDTTSEDKPLIEIPQKYYEQLEEERIEKEKKEQEKQIQEAQAKEFSALSGKILTLVLFNAVVIFACLFITAQKIKYALFVIPIFIVIMSITKAIKEGKENNYPLSVLIGGMVVAVITFIVSTLKEDMMDLWTYFAIGGAITAFLGLIISNAINKLINRREEIKALQTIGYILFFVILIGAPIYLYNKYPVEFNRLVFRSVGEIKAETEEEFVIKTLKSRYNIDFKCSDDVQPHVDFKNRLASTRTCTTPDNKKVEVYSTAYNETKNQYVVVDDLMNILFFKDYEEKLASEIAMLNSSKEVKVYFYPEEGCRFIGNCVDIKDYRDNLAKEEDIEHQYKISSTLDLSKYMNNYDAVKVINDGKYKVYVRIIGKYFGGVEEFEEVVNKTEEYLNESGLKNNFGYIIVVQSYDSSKNHVQTEYEVTGSVATSDKKFNNAEVTFDGN